LTIRLPLLVSSFSIIDENLYCLSSWTLLLDHLLTLLINLWLESAVFSLRVGKAIIVAGIPQLFLSSLIHQVASLKRTHFSVSSSVVAPIVFGEQSWLKKVAEYFLILSTNSILLRFNSFLEFFLF
jgi:hypothetical protein